MAGRKKKRTGDRSFGERMAALRAHRAARGRRDPRKSLTVTRKITVTKKKSSATKKKTPSCTLEACRKLLARAEASMSAAQRRKVEAAWKAGASERSERALSRMMGPPMLFGTPRPRRETSLARELGRFEGTFEERMGPHGRGFEGPLSPAHDRDRSRSRKRKSGRKAKTHRSSMSHLFRSHHSGRRDASLMDMRDSRGDWRLNHAGHVRAGKKGARRRGLHVKRRDASGDTGGDWRFSHAGHVRAGKKAARGRGLHVKRRDASNDIDRDMHGDWRLNHAGHVRAGKKGARRRGLHVKRRDPGQNFGERMAALRDTRGDWKGDRPGHRKAAKKGWSHRHLCAAHSRGHGRRDAGRDSRGDWPGDHAGHVRAGKKGARRRHACAQCAGR